MTRLSMKKVTEPRFGTGEARQHRLQLGELSDSQVVQSSLDGDTRAFGELVRRYDQRLLNFVYRTIGDRERAQDLPARGVREGGEDVVYAGQSADAAASAMSFGPQVMESAA